MSIPEANNRKEAAESVPQGLDEAGINQLAAQTTMEVHHHAHHGGKKGWRSYIWEFLMLFLAVFCGFLAEYQLEHVIEHQREKAYIRSMIEDTRTDRINFRKAITQNEIRLLHLDSLASYCLNYTAGPLEDSAIYHHYIYGLIHPAVVSPTERTLLQLKNAGGMRLIQKKAAVDSIILYDDLAKKLTDQRSFYELYQNNSISLAAQLFNFKKFGIGMVGKNQAGIRRDRAYFRLISTDKTKLMEFANIIIVYEGVVQYYNLLLTQMESHALNLEKVLAKEYHLN